MCGGLQFNFIMCIDYCHKVDLEIKAMGETPPKLMTSSLLDAQRSKVDMCVWSLCITVLLLGFIFHKPRNLGHKCLK